MILHSGTDDYIAIRCKPLPRTVPSDLMILGSKVQDDNKFPVWESSHLTSVLNVVPRHPWTMSTPRCQLEALVVSSKKRKSFRQMVLGQPIKHLEKIKLYA